VRSRPVQRSPTVIASARATSELELHYLVEHHPPPRSLPTNPYLSYGTPADRIRSPS
jgi:hypothetical protein